MATKAGIKDPQERALKIIEIFTENAINVKSKEIAIKCQLKAQSNNLYVEQTFEMLVEKLKQAAKSKAILDLTNSSVNETTSQLKILEDQIEKLTTVVTNNNTPVRNFRTLNNIRPYQNYSRTKSYYPRNNFNCSFLRIFNSCLCCQRS